MKDLFKKIKEYFEIAPMFITLTLSFVGILGVSLVMVMIQMIRESGSVYFWDIISVQLMYYAILLPFVLTSQNIFFLFSKPKSVIKEKVIKKWEVEAVLTGIIFSFFGLMFTDIVSEDWHVQIYEGELHTPLEMKSSMTFVIIVLVAIIGYMILRFLPLSKLPPLAAVICISALYLGIVQSILLCIQIFKASDVVMVLFCLLPFNCALIAIRTIKHVVYQQRCKKYEVPSKYKHLVILLNNTSNWPWIAFIAAIPLLGLIVVVLLLFGQEPDSIIKVWTQTADWRMSQMVPPENLPYDGHYLCTVAAGGHRKVVRPIRTGKRHGHRVLVNRQLCIANAFEQLIEERAPGFHRLVRGLYDKTGYPIARHIKSPYVADVIYFIMKPLEWLFLFTLYLFDLKPENRIALQYPHSPPPAL